MSKPIPQDLRPWIVNQTPGFAWFSVWDGETRIADCLTEKEANIVSNSRDMVKMVSELKFALEWSLEVIGDNLGLDEQGTPKHDCAFLSDPEAGHCNFHDEYWNAKALIKEANEETQE